MRGQVFWITGFSGVGKTTIGTRLYYELKKNYPQIVFLDDDVIEGLFGGERTDVFTESGKKRALQCSELCRILAMQGFTVICCVAAMFDGVRDWNRQNIPNYYDIYIRLDSEGVGDRDIMTETENNAELPRNDNIIISNNMDGNIDRYIDEILLKTLEIQNNDAIYWDGYYKNQRAPKSPSDFARFVMESAEPNKKLIDLGCGNGRDSVYFCDCGLKVTAVDLSTEAVASIDKMKPILTVCDDFVTTKALFCVDYDYCYSRWSIHAITKVQQDELLANVYNALKEDGTFFIEARTINDPKYGQGKRLGLDEYFLDNHYRRFINTNSLTEQLVNVGFSVVYCEESDSFSVVGDDCPNLVRIIAKKKNNSANNGSMLV